MDEFNLLEKINTPSDIKHLSDDELVSLCSQIREKIITTVSKNGGHLASNLGAVELTVAIHKSFDSPEDQIVFDVGHQCYTHKLLTGRYESFGSLRKKDGISGFTNPEESVHDIFYSGHSSTSVSAAIGLARAKKIKGEKGYVIAVIGDGSLTGGEAYEGLNNATRELNNLIIIINDNKMSISKNKSSLASNLTKIRNTKRYYQSKDNFERFLSKIPLVGRAIRNRLVRYKYALKGVLYHSSFFEDLGFAYLGPVNGHDLEKLGNLLEVAKYRGKPSVIHVETVKGKGYLPAEEDPEHFHGVGPFDIETGLSKSSAKSFSSAFSDALISFAESDKRICAITAAMPTGTGLEEFSKKFESRYFDVGIAEQHAVTFCSGLAKNGMIPFFAVYSTFLQRAYDQIIHDVSLQKQKIILAIDRAGLVGSDGQTHQGLFDIPMLNSIPDINIYAPSCFSDLHNHIYRAVYQEEFSSAVRYPRGGEGVMPENYTPDGKDYTVFETSGAKKTLLVTFGRTFCDVYKAKNELEREGISVNILKLNKIKPINSEAVEYARSYENIFFYEESMKVGGVAEHFAARLGNIDFRGNFEIRAVENRFVKPAEVGEQLKEFGLDAESIIRDIKGE